MINGLRETLRDDFLLLYNENSQKIKPKEKNKEDIQIEIDNKNLDILMNADIL